MNDNLTKLKELTKELPLLSNVIEKRYKDSISYKMLHGVCTGEELFYHQTVAVQRSFMSKGAVFPIHLHKENEWLIVSRGHLKSINESKTTELKDGDGIRIKEGESHVVEAIEDTWLIGITIPASEGYPHG